MKILHMASHYGGGVGSVMKAWQAHDTENNHVLTYLNDVPENDRPGQVLFNPEMVNNADIVVCHVWNHPALFELLVTKKLPKCRLIGWSHMSGLHAPYLLFDKLVNYFDRFYYTSPISNGTGIKRDYIWSSCDIQKFLDLERKEHTGFNVGYVGTLDFCKLSPDFMRICQSILECIPKAHFIIVGGGSDENKLKEQARELGISHAFEFMGVIDDVRPVLAVLDLFLYPLQEKHFGTCEQVLGEAMAVGIPVVVLDNPAERFIVSNRVNGFICHGISEIIDAVETVRDYDPYYISKNAVLDSSILYSIKNKVSVWNSVFTEIMKEPKREREWLGSNPFIEGVGPVTGKLFQDYLDSKEKGDSYDIYEFCIPNFWKLFNSNSQWSSENKGSIRQYACYFKNDMLLQELLKILEKWEIKINEMSAMQRKIKGYRNNRN